MNIISKVTDKISTILDKSKLEALARKTGMMKRRRKIDPKDFLENLIVMTMNSKTCSLSELAYELETNDCPISKQALHKKYNDNSIAFLRNVLEQILQQANTEINIQIDKIPFIKSIKAVDSSEIALHSHLKEYGFEQTRGNGASFKLQAQIDALNNRVINFDICKANETDQGYKEHLKHIEPNELWLGDLGYFCVNSFATIEEKNAYFLSRYFKTTNVYDAVAENKLDLRSILQNIKTDILNYEIKLGISKFPCRLVAIRLTEEAYRKRQAGILKKHRRDKRVSIKPDILDKWTIFVTNLPFSVDGMLLLQIYSLRWQIELFFKMMKNFFNLRIIEHSNKPQAMLSIYASLIAMSLLGIISIGLTQIEISIYKAGKFFTKSIKEFFCRFKAKKENAIIWLRNILNKYAQKESRQNRLSTLGAIRGFDNVAA